MSWESRIIPGYGPNGKPILSVIAKRTYEFMSGRVILANNQLGLIHTDIPRDPSNPFYSEILAETDLVAFKPNTDVVVLSKAYTPKGKKAYHLECEVQVGPVHKKITVYGDRKVESKLIRGLMFTDPVPFEMKEIGYTHAYGGRARSREGTLFPFPSNPLGKGFHLKGGFENYSELLVPNCENPDSPLTPDSLVLEKYEDWVKAPKPTSFGWTRQTFFPRYTFAGIIPEMLAGGMDSGNTIDPATPKLDPRFYQGASEGFCNCVLAGNEHVKLTYMDPEHPFFEFDLPGEKPVITIKEGSILTELKPVLQTVLIDKENGSLSMVWRGSKDIQGISEENLPSFEYTAV